jgi:hypothetical protein
LVVLQSRFVSNSRDLTVEVVTQRQSVPAHSLEDLKSIPVPSVLSLALTSCQSLLHYNLCQMILFGIAVVLTIVVNFGTTLISAHPGERDIHRQTYFLIVSPALECMTYGCS